MLNILWKLKFYSWGVCYMLFLGFLQMLYIKMKTPWPVSLIYPPHPEKCFGSRSAEITWHSYFSSPSGSTCEWEMVRILLILLIGSAYILHLWATLCLPFRPVEDIHRRRSSDQPDVFKSCVQNRAWRFGEGFVPGKVWKGPLLNETDSIGSGKERKLKLQLDCRLILLKSTLP